MLVVDSLGIKSGGDVKSRLTPTSLSTGEKVCNVGSCDSCKLLYQLFLKCVHSYRVDKVAMVTDCVVAMVIGYTNCCYGYPDCAIYFVILVEIF